ncbi:hypothetical protein [Nonomuraea dietziae]|uniref:hypothetical protein n=1 Tax=Nonomuraea dietziae TaxID=65515 RepID=UPI0031D05014
MVGGDLDDPRLEAPHPLNGELPGQQATEPPVIRIVHDDEHAGRRLVTAPGQDVAPRKRRVLEIHPDAEAWIGQDPACGVVAGDQPADVAVRKGQPGEGLGVTQPRQLFGRVERAGGVAPGGQGHRGSEILIGH